MGIQRNSVEIQQLSTPQGLDQRSKKEEIVPKMASQKDSDGDNPEGTKAINIIKRF